MRPIVKNTTKTQVNTINTAESIIRAYAIEQHKTALEFMQYLNEEEKKEEPSRSRIELYGNLWHDAYVKRDAACEILNRIAGFDPAEKWHYVNAFNEIEIMNVTPTD